jgi:hypothetical protein
LVLLHDFLIYILLLIASPQDLEQCMDYFNNIRGSESFWYSVLYTFLTTFISGAFFVGLRVTRRRLVVEYTVEEERRGGPETYQALLAVPGEREPEKELSPSKRGESREIGIQVEPEESWEDIIDYAEQGTQTIRTHYLEKDEYTQTDSIAVRAVKVGTDPVQIRPAGVQTVLSLPIPRLTLPPGSPSPRACLPRPISKRSVGNASTYSCAVILSCAG